MRYITTIYLFLAFTITSCSYKQTQVLLQQNATDTVATKSYANISNYQIRPHDILQITNVQANKSLVDITAGVAQTNTALGGANKRR
ncbi:hypothetical protein [Mucilaginibacter antarcticus]|uniref:hypothetical protein n=1 Tax=Mucilaginibacter antarcticus TaxID=1855725 RepID=UPI0036311E80